MNLYTVKFFAKAIRYGSKYVYQTIPRLLTIWLDVGEHVTLSSTETFTKLNAAVAKAITETPAYKVRPRLRYVTSG
jgi:serine/threonine-protein kinase ATR